MDDLLARIAHPDTLAAAWERVRLRNAAGGSDRRTVAAFANDAPRTLERLHQELLAERYVPDPLLEVRIPKGFGKPGLRRLELPTVRDKVVQQAARDIIEPLLDRTFLDCSYGYRPRKGPARAIARVSHLIVSGKCAWAAAGDVDECFPSIPHDRLESALHAAIPDARVVRLLMLWCLTGTVTRDGAWQDAADGVQQGNVVGPLLANLFLHGFDAAITAAGHALVRYADDFLILAREEAAAHRAAADAKRVLGDVLGLRLNDGACRVVPLAQGCAFLGIRFVGRARQIDPPRLDKARYRVAGLVASAAHEQLPAVRDRFAQTLTGWHRYYARVLPPDALLPLAKIAADGLAELAATWRACGQSPGVVAGAIRALRLAWPDALAEVTALAGAPGPGGAQVVQGALRQVRPAQAVARRRKREWLTALEAEASLVVTSPGSFIGRTAGFLVVRRARKEEARVPLARLRAVTVTSRGVSLSEDAIAAAAERGVPVVFISPHGQVKAIAAASGRHDAATVSAQCRVASDPALALPIATAFVSGKVRNQLRLARYWGKHHRHASPGFAVALDALDHAARAANVALCDRTPLSDGTSERAWLMGTEGRVAARYWQVVAALVEEAHAFPGREHRGARDLVNALLNYGYAVLQSRVHVALVRAGLLPEVGLLHTPRRGEPVLAFDLMEEFRAPVVDRAILALLGRRQPVGQEGDGLLTRQARALAVQAVTERLAAPARHDGGDEPLQTVIERQAARLAESLRTGVPYRSYRATW